MTPEEFQELARAAAATAVAAVSTQAPVVIVTITAPHLPSNKVLQIVSHHPPTEEMAELADAVLLAIRDVATEVVESSLPEADWDIDSGNVN